MANDSKSVATKATYNEIGRARIGGGRCAVISECSKGGYTIAQQIEGANGELTPVFLRGAIHVADYESLRAMASALHDAVMSVAASNFVDRGGGDEDEVWAGGDRDDGECPVIDNEANEAWEK